MIRSIFLLLLAMAVVSSCSRPEHEIPAEQLAQAVDSAYRTVWMPNQTWGDTTHHTRFYDSVLSYIRSALPIEGDKRAYAAELIDLAALSPMNLSTAAHRKASEAALGAYSSRNALWRAEIDSLNQRYVVFIRHTLDTLYRKDTSKFATALPDLLRQDLFQPAWRPHYDSVQSEIVAGSLAMLYFLDSNAKQIEFDTVLRFQDPELASRYESLMARLTTLGEEESELARRLTASSQPGEEQKRKPDSLPARDTVARRPF